MGGEKELFETIFRHIKRRNMENHSRSNKQPIKNKLKKGKRKKREKKSKKDQLK